MVPSYVFLPIVPLVSLLSLGETLAFLSGVLHAFLFGVPLAFLLSVLLVFLLVLEGLFSVFATGVSSKPGCSWTFSCDYLYA